MMGLELQPVPDANRDTGLVVPGGVLTLPAINSVIAGGSVADQAALQSLVSRYLPPPGSQHVSALLFGDSLSAQSGGASPDPTRPLAPSQYAYGSNGYFTWLNIALGGPFYPVYNCGVGNQTTTQMLTRVDSDVPAGAYYDYCFTEFGINNFIIRGDTDPAATIADTIALWQKLRPRCGVLEHTPIWPNDSITAAQRAAVVAVNDWVYKNHRAYGVTLATALVNTFVDTTDANRWAIRNDVTSDNTHPHSYGACIGGAAYARELAHLKTVSRISPLGPTNLLVNGELAGTAGTKPTSWNAFGTLSGWTYSARPDGESGTIVTVAAADFVNMTQNINTPVVGNKCVAELEYWCNTPSAQINLQAIAGTVTAQAVKPASPDTSTWSIPASGVLRTPEFVIPSGATTLTVYVQCMTPATISFGRAVCRYV